MTFNGVDLAESFTDSDKGTYFIVNNVDGRGVLGEEIETIEVPGMAGAYQSSKHTPVRELNVSISMKGESFEDLRKQIDRLSAILVIDKPAEISFTDEPGIVYYGSLAGVEHKLEISGIYQAVLKFICPDPFKYGKEQTYPFSSVPLEDGIGRNLATETKNIPQRFSGYKGTNVSFVENVSVPEWNATDAVRITTSGGEEDIKLTAYNLGKGEDGKVYTWSAWVKNTSSKSMRVSNNHGDLDTLESGEQKRITLTSMSDGNKWIQFVFYSESQKDDLDFIFWNPKIEEGSEATPYSQAPEDRPSDILTLNYGGTAPASPIFELEVLKPVTFAMVQNQFEEYQLIGIPLEADMETVDTRKLLIEERGETLDTWSNTPTKVDGGVVAGRLSTDNDGITVPSYGPDTNNWHGPALIKEISPSQDFEIEMMVEGETGKPDQTYRIEFYAYDENMNVLGKMALLDKSLGINNKIAEGRIGDYIGKQENYLISSQNYSYGWPFFFGMLRLRRIGNQFEFYVTRVANNTKHVFSLKKLFTDNNNEYMGKLRYVQIHIGKWADSARAYAPKILHIKVFKLAQETVDQTPYIANPGDKITLDNFNKEILLNGEDSKNLKDFGGSFFNLHKGDNQLVVHPSNSFKATAKWRNRYR